MIFLYGALWCVAMLIVSSAVILSIHFIAAKYQLNHKNCGFGYGDFTSLHTDSSVFRFNMYTGKRAVVACTGAQGSEAKLFTYRGYNDCKSLSMLYSGDNACQWSCLGKGDCASVCKCGAIAISHNVAVIGQTCIGCGECVSVCPQHLISLVPSNADYAVLCSSEAGKDTQLFCPAGCTECGACVVSAGHAGFRMDYEHHHAVLEYDRTGSKDIGEKLCAPKCIKKLPDTQKNDFNKYRFWGIINTLHDIGAALLGAHKAG